MKITREQQEALQFIVKHIKDNHVIAIDGAAGTGKTTIIGELIRRLKKEGHEITLTAYTNKAVQVLRVKGLRSTDTFHGHCLQSEYSVMQKQLIAFLHKLDSEPFLDFPDNLIQHYGKASLMALRKLPHYRRMSSSMLKPAINNKYKPKPAKKGILIVDEASMINKEELLAAKKVFSKIVLVGDSHQLAPVSGTAVFETIKPVFTLTKVLRQPLESNARELAFYLRNCDVTNLKTSGKVSLKDKYQAVMEGRTPIITYTNKRRQQINDDIRRLAGYDGLPPQIGELLVCSESYSRYSKTKELFNGSFWRVISSSAPYVCTIKNTQTNHVLHDVPVRLEGVNDLLGYDFDYAYCLTAHTAQGSEFESVIVDRVGWNHWQSRNNDIKDNKRKYLSWLYTAVTRARIDVYQLSA